MPDLRVLQSFPEPRATTNPYVTQLLDVERQRCEVDCFSWANALVARHDIVHLHWPEILLRAHTRPRAVVRRVLATAFLARLHVGRVAVVRTVHNVTPHEEPGRFDRWWLKRLQQRTDLWIRLNPTTPTPDARRTATIAHGHYRDWFAPYPLPAPVPGRLAFVGLIREYKNVPSLVAAFSALDDPALSLHVVGDPASALLRGQVETMAARDPRVRALLGHADDALMANEIGSATLVVLPYREMQNSGAALLALSLQRPVLLPDSDATRALADEVGNDWVFSYSGALSNDTLARAVAEAGSAPREPLLLANRDWPAIAKAHLEAYQRALQVRSSRRRLSRR